MQVLIGTVDGLRRPDGTVSVEAPVGDLTSIARLGRNRWALLGGGRALHRSLDGNRWKLIAPIRLDWPGTCLLPAPDGVFIGTAEAHLVQFGPNGTSKVNGFERVARRDSWYTPWGGPPDTRSMSRAPDGTIYVNVHVGGIPRSRDGGKTWEPTIDVDADVHQVLAHDSWVLAATAYGLARSGDGGRTWAFEADGLDAPYSRAVAVADDMVLVSASTGPRGSRAAVYRKPLGSTGPFERCAAGLPEWFDANIDSHCLVAGGSLAALGTADGRLFVSRDAGATWDQEGAELSAIRCLALV